MKGNKLVGTHLSLGSNFLYHLYEKNILIVNPGQDEMSLNMEQNDYALSDRYKRGIKLTLLNG